MLASPADVFRVMGNPAGLTDSDVEKELEAAESYLRTKLPRWDDETGGTEKYYHLRGTSQLPLPSPDAIVSQVRLYYGYRDATGEVVPTTDYATRNGYLMLLRDDVSTWYARGEVDWTSLGVVPAAVRDGVALTAAALYDQRGRLTTGMRSERIGDYSYTLSDKDVETVMPPKARELLKPFMKRRAGVFVT